MERLSIERVSDQEFILSGELDRSTVDRFEAALDGTRDAGARDAGARVVLDLSRVTFVDSSGVRSLIGLGRSLGSSLVLRDPSPRVRRVLELRGLAAAGLWTVESSIA
jgi:anti-anti-sigma factor